MSRPVITLILGITLGIVAFGAWALIIALASLPLRTESCINAPYELGQRPQCVKVGEGHVKRAL